MIRLEIPGWDGVAEELGHLVLDLNGTVALDGHVIPGISERLVSLSAHMDIHLVTADTRGQAEQISKKLGCQLIMIEPGYEASQKQALVERLATGQYPRRRSAVVAIGNGVNDARMLAAATLGIAVLGAEGLSVEALRAASLLVARIEDGLDLLLHPQRLAATLRR